MSKIQLRYTSACRDTSGYASAARSYITALLNTGEVDITMKVASFEQTKIKHEAFEKATHGLVEKQLPFNVQIVHLTPENFPACRVPNVYNIAYTAWETEMLPHGWPELLNSMDEVWVPSQWNEEVFRASGVKVPITVIPHVIYPPLEDSKNTVTFPAMDDDAYIFYSIFQWIERKNPRALLTAYFTEFTKEDKAFLLLKTYRMNASNAEKQLIRNDIESVKHSLRLPWYPPLIFFGELLDKEQMAAIHHRCDCYVSLQRGEGFGIPLAQAMIYGNPVITSNYGGCREFMNKDNSFLVDTRRAPVQGMLFPNYHGKMVWGDPSVMDARRLMRYCYENREDAKRIGQQAAQDIQSKLNEKAVAQMMIDRLRTILASRGQA